MDCSKYRIRNVWTVKGDGSEPQKAEVLISSDGKILAAGGPFIGCGEVIDGNKRILSPGFIDAHGHSDISVLAYPEGFSKVSQGVTTEIAGNCGLSAFPVTQENHAHLQSLYGNYGVDITWESCAEYLDFCTTRGSLMKLVPLCGHNTLRAACCGYEDVEIRGAEIDSMCQHLDRELAAGAAGLSFGLLYTPGICAGEEEIAALMKVAARHGKVCTAHLRSEGEKLIESGVDVTELLSNKLNHPIREIHYYMAMKLIETMFFA